MESDEAIPAHHYQGRESGGQSWSHCGSPVDTAARPACSGHAHAHIHERAEEIVRAALAATGGGSESRREDRPTTRGRGVRVGERDLFTRGLKDNGCAAPTPQRDELEAGPGRGPYSITRPLARRLRRRTNDETNAISKARDRSGPALYKFSSRTRAARPHQHTTRPRHQSVGRHRGLGDNGERSEPSSSGASWDRIHFHDSGSRLDYAIEYPLEIP